MKRILVHLGILEGKKVTAEFMLDAEIVKLTKRAPRTAAEKAFHTWLYEYKTKVAKGTK